MRNLLFVLCFCISIWGCSTNGTIPSNSNTNGRLSKIEYQFNGSTWVTLFTYDDNGRIIKVDDGDEVTTYTRNSSGIITQISSIVAASNYNSNTVFNIDASGKYISSNQSDSYGQLAQITYTYTGDRISESIETISSSSTKRKYFYNNSGNIIKEETFYNSGSTWVLLSTQNYTYDSKINPIDFYTDLPNSINGPNNCISVVNGNRSTTTQLTYNNLNKPVTAVSISYNGSQQTGLSQSTFTY